MGFFPVFFYVMALEKQLGYQSNIFLYDGNKNQTDLIAKKAITPKRLDCLGRRGQTLKNMNAKYLILALPQSFASSNTINELQVCVVHSIGVLS